MHFMCGPVITVVQDAADLGVAEVTYVQFGPCKLKIEPRFDKFNDASCLVGICWIFFESIFYVWISEVTFIEHYHFRFRLHRAK
ncbi:hypothetical protein AVDCRST_MAG81-1241 [uncultured Synechococcales cyanobacterium]|uniref:Uncharacterized protein n=1 Tax=uncultured Synechococcales cyanobacterium TaxID=1936017 RepID=A0A6J4V3E6_9CYAN|nr:hypothetical protein AVDCRST_MAG81-1241 [uncultured Synechococcales cyanobacterium]